MSIRPIDYQTMIPKASEVQKIRHAELLTPQNNDATNIQKNQEQIARNLRRVNETKKAFEGKINRDDPKKQQNNKEQDEQDERDKKKQKDQKKQSIDIRI